MTVKIKKPILIAGVSISFLLWFWQTLQNSFSEIGEYSLLGLMAMGAVFWWWKPKPKLLQTQEKVYSPVSETLLEKTFVDCENLLNQLANEKGETSLFLNQLTSLKQGVSRNNLEIAVTGRKKAGKSSLVKKLQSSLNFSDLSFVKINAVEEEVNNQDQTLKINGKLLNPDLLLFVINGDLTDSEWQIIKTLSHYNQRLLLVFNQKDRYTEDEQIILSKQLQQTVKTVINSEDILTIATSPTQIKVKKHQGDGVFEELMETPQADLDNLLNRLKIIISQEKSSLILSQTYRQTINVKNNIQNSLNEGRKKVALPIIEQYQLIAAAAAFANPVSSLDLLATLAINTQMLIDLSEIYKQKLSIEKAKTISTTIGKLMVSLGIVEFSTQTLGSVLKTNAITYIAGATVQGVSAAYLTRIAGLSLIEYFQIEENSTESDFSIDKLKQKIKAVFQENQRSVFLKSFVKNTASQLSLNKA